MDSKPAIHVVGGYYGPCRECLPLNPDFRAESPKLKTTLRIEWDAQPVRPALQRLGERLRSFSPSFARHQCSGTGAYHIHDSKQAAGSNGEPVEAGLALAHFMEHLMIDVVSYVSAAVKVSGATGAHRDAADQYDVFVECAHPAVAHLALDLTLGWMEDLTQAVDFDRDRWTVLDAARALYQRSPFDISVVEAATLGGIDRQRMDRAFAWLARKGIADLEPYAMNVDGSNVYRLSVASVTATAAD